MTSDRSSGLNVLRASALTLLALAALAVLPAYRFKGTVVSAACTRSGKATVTPDGLFVCDCTQLDNGGNCTCIIECPRPGLEE
jgi:hypothetical protein